MDNTPQRGKEGRKILIEYPRPGALAVVGDVEIDRLDDMARPGGRYGIRWLETAGIEDGHPREAVQQVDSRHHTVFQVFQTELGARGPWLREQVAKYGWFAQRPSPVSPRLGVLATGFQRPNQR